MKFSRIRILVGMMFLATAQTSGAATTSSTNTPPSKPKASQPAKFTQAQLFLQKANEYHDRRELAQAIEYFTRAIQLDNTLDEAYFGRGMARGSAGLIDEGIKDLSVYIARRPDSSRAHTKRGIRYLWKGDTENAYQDFLKAIALDPGNAEAHDDIGVIYAQRREYKKALERFGAVVRLEPQYFKAHHNMAVVFSILDQPEPALTEVNKALQLKPDARNSMRLKSVILKRLGRHKEAHEAGEEAEFMPEENWSEVAPLK